MPKRSRTHQLEDISIQQFERLLPDAWVSRRKDKDYGVDMEVEVFDDEGHATGLMFFVQLKATDDADKARAVSMKVDRLKYLASLDAPSMVLRYSEPSRAFHWIWLAEIFARVAPPDTETVTVKFEEADAWREETPIAILRTLRIYRTMRLGSRRMPVGLEVIINKADANSAFALNHAVGRIMDASNRIIWSADPAECLPLRVCLDENVLSVEIDTIASISTDLRSTERDEIFAQLIYVIAYMVGRADFDNQLYKLATIIRQDGLRCQSRWLASKVASAVVEKPEVAAGIASLNALQDRQDDAYGFYIHALLEHSGSRDAKAAAINRFFREAIAAHKEQSHRAQAAIYYSFGNSLRIALDFPSAFRQFNLARKKYPDYLVKAYFLNELGATLYFLNRFCLSSKVYAASYELEAAPKTAICAGDAFLFSGDPGRAEEFYRIAAGSEDQIEATEGGLKAYLAGWVQEFRANNEEVSTKHLSQPELWSDVMRDGVDETRYDQALCGALLLSFLLEDDPEAWSAAIQIALKDGNAQFIASTLSCAIYRCGYNAYSKFRDMLLAQEFPPEFVRQFDEIADTLQNTRRATALEKPIMRLIETPEFDIAMQPSTDG